MAKRPKSGLGDFAVPKSAQIVPHQPAPAPMPAATRQPVSAAKPTKEAHSKAMTLKLTETDYRRLKRYGFENDLTSQAILESLVLKFLDDEGV
jgi:hypothetical protein